MKLARKIILLFLAAFLTMLVGFGYLEARRALGAADERARNELAITGRSLRPAMAEVLKVEGEARARAVVRRADVDNAAVAIRWVDVDEAALGAADRARVARGEEVALERPTPEGGRLFVYVPVQSGALELSQLLDEDHHVVLAAVEERVAAALVALLAAALLSVVAGVWLVGRPMRALAAHAERIGHGDLSRGPDLRRADEIGVLASEMNKMCDRLLDARARLAAEADARVKAMDQLRHADRLRTVGTLASGMAHEMGTPLSIVGGRAKMIAATGAGEDVTDSARIIQGQVERMTKIIRNLLGFARRDSSLKKPGDLREIARRTIDLLAPLASKSDVVVRLEGDDAPPPVDVDAGQVEQALANLVVNSIHASRAGGEVLVGVSTVRARPPADHGGEEGEFVRVHVRDRGEGITPEHLHHVFEPFFTTKDVGEGTGLGLSVAYGIMKDHGGWIDAESEPREGSAFFMYFPRGADA